MGPANETMTVLMDKLMCSYTIFHRGIAWNQKAWINFASISKVSLCYTSNENMCLLFLKKIVISTIYFHYKLNKKTCTSFQNLQFSMCCHLRNFVIEGVACQPPSSLRRLQATPQLQTSLYLEKVRKSTVIRNPE